jgi:hypothetical protein
MIDQDAVRARRADFIEELRQNNSDESRDMDMLENGGWSLGQVQYSLIHRNSILEEGNFVLMSPVINGDNGVLLFETAFIGYDLTTQIYLLDLHNPRDLAFFLAIKFVDSFS